jgi:rubrerythrin
MSITFNADEIFEMAEEIERNAARLYRQGAKKAAEKETKEMFLKLAAMEDKHLNTFRLMREELTENEKKQVVFDPDNEATMYLQAMADGRGTEGKASTVEMLTGNETTEELIKTAINAEKDSVVFYVSLKNLVTSEAGRDKVEDIIKEEISHLIILKKQMATLKR